MVTPTLLINTCNSHRPKSSQHFLLHRRRGAILSTCIMRYEFGVVSQMRSCINVVTHGLQAVYNVNPCFNVYHITDYCEYCSSNLPTIRIAIAGQVLTTYYHDLGPLLGDVLGNPGGLSCLPQTLYFNRTDVKKAIHAPDISWSECGEHDVFLGKFVHGIGKVSSKILKFPRITGRGSRFEECADGILGTGRRE